MTVNSYLNPVSATQLRSVVDGVLWPAIGSDRAAHMLALLFQLEQSQWLSPEKLRERQMIQLKRLIQHAQATVPFYANSLQNLDAEHLDWNNFRALPILSRRDLQANFGALRSAAVPSSHGNSVLGQSSGSTGTPARFMKTGVDQLFWNALTLRDHLWHERNFQGRFVAIRNIEDNALYPSWGPPTDIVFQTGPAGVLRIDTPIPAQANWLREQNPDYLLSYPTNIRALAKHCIAEGIGLPRLREVRSMGEVIGSDLRDLCRRAWNAHLVDIYSCQEAGYLAMQCPEGETYHVQSESVVLELLRNDGIPCAPGEAGRIVLTSLHNYAMPLIRYEIGDYAEWGESCTCGRGLPVILRVMGRGRNILTYPTGEKHFPLLGGERYPEFAPVRQYQIIQRSLHEIEARLVVERPITLNEELALKEFMLSKLGYPFELNFIYPANISIGASGKFEDFISEIT